MALASFSINPLPWKGINLSDPRALKLFLQQLSDFSLQVESLLAQLQSSVTLAGILNGSGLIQGSAIASSTITEAKLVFVGHTFGTVGTNQSLDCSGATSVGLSLQMSAALTLTLQNLTAGASVFMRIINGTAGALVFKLATTTPSYQMLFAAAGTETNLGTTGASLGAFTIKYFIGNSDGAGNLFFGFI